MDNGTLIAQIFTARQSIPIQGVTATIFQGQGSEKKVIAVRTTNRSGKTEPVEIETPDIDISLEPNEAQGFTTVNVQLDHPEYYSTLVENVQIFPEQKSIQLMEMIPIEEYAKDEKRNRIYDVTPQNL